MDKLEEIFKLQEELNDKVFAKQGILSPGENHFPLTTLDIRSQLRDNEYGPNGLPNTWLRNYLRALQEESKEVEDELLWKWWSKDQIDLQNIRVEIIDMMHFLVSMALAAGMTADDFHRVYTQKHKVNENRQESGYSQATKDESDNKDIS